LRIMNERETSIKLHSLTKSWEDWTDLDDFHVALDLEVVWAKNPERVERFAVHAVSPRRLGRLLGKTGIQVGRGLLIMNDFHMGRVRETVERLIRQCDNGAPEESILKLAQHFRRKAVWVKEVIDDDEVIITDGEFELICLHNYIEIEPGREVTESFFRFCWCDRPVQKSQDRVFLAEKEPADSFGYWITAQLIDRQKGIAKLGEILIGIGDHFAGEIHEGDFVTFHCCRLDL
jgi:hypothetical protein